MQEAAVRMHSDAVGVGHLDGVGGVNAEGLRDIQTGSRAAYLHFGDRHGAGLGVSLGQKQFGVADAGDGIVTVGGTSLKLFVEGLAGVGLQGDSGVVELLSLGGGRVGDRRAGVGSAFEPLHLRDAVRCAAGNGAGEVQRLALDRGINRGGHAGDGRLGDNNRNCFWQGCCITCCNICYIVRC